MDRGAWRVIVHSVTKTWTQLKQHSMHIHITTNNFLLNKCFKFPVAKVLIQGKKLKRAFQNFSTTILGRRSLVSCRLWGCTESDTTEAAQQQQQQHIIQRHYPKNTKF